jgi:hypothetical protein
MNVTERSLSACAGSLRQVQAFMTLWFYDLRGMTNLNLVTSTNDGDLRLKATRMGNMKRSVGKTTS